MVKMMDRLEAGRSLPDLSALMIGSELGFFETGDKMDLVITGRGQRFRRKYLRDRREAG